MEQSIGVPTNVFTHFDTFNIICSFLSLKDKLALTSTNKLISYFLQEHFNYFLNQPLSIYDKLPDRSMRQLMKYNFNRNLKVVKIPSILSGGKQQSTHFNFFKNKCITKIYSEGKYFIGFENNKGEVYVGRVNEFWPVKYNPQIQYEVFRGVKKVSCKAEKLFVLGQDGVVSTAMVSEHPERVYENLSVIEWTLRVPVVDIAVSKNYAVFVLGPIKMSEIKKYVLLEESIGEDKEEKEENVKVIAYNIQTCEFYIINYPHKKVRSFCVGSNTAYFVNQHNELIHSTLTNLNQGQTSLNATIYPPFQNRKVISIFGGLYHYIALIRQQTTLQNWNNQQVIQWLRRQGFDDYINIMKVEKIDGKRLVNIEKKFMEDRLGITNTNLQQKILLSIEENMKISYDKDLLFGWGKNETGQLGNNMTVFAAKPIRIKLPELAKGEYVVDVICGWYNSIVRTSEGRVFITTQQFKKDKEKEKEKEKKEQEDMSDEELKEMDRERKNRRKKTQDEQDKDTTTKSNKNTKKKKGLADQKPVQKQKQKYEEQSHWVQYKNQSGCFNISTSKDIILITQLAYKEEESKKKIRTVKAVLDKILWDPNLKKQEYKVGYFDKYMGILDIKVEEYLKSEVKEHRISYLKRNGQVVWHKEDKIDIV